MTLLTLSDWLGGWELRSSFIPAAAAGTSPVITFTDAELVIPIWGSTVLTTAIAVANRFSQFAFLDSTAAQSVFGTENAQTATQVIQHSFGIGLVALATHLGNNVPIPIPILIGRSPITLGFTAFNLQPADVFTNTLYYFLIRRIG